jgi:hypothetical protein
VVTADRARRRAVLILSALAGAMLLAGVLPWVTGGESTIRFLALPLLLAGLMVLGVTLRVWVAGRRPAPSAPPVERGCDGCVCGRQGECATAEQPGADPQPAAERAGPDLDPAAEGTGARPQPAAERAGPDSDPPASQTGPDLEPAAGRTGARPDPATAERTGARPDPAAAGRTPAAG